MKNYLLLACGAALLGCSNSDGKLEAQVKELVATQQEIKGELAALKTELSKEPPKMRWATIQRSQVSIAISKRTAEFIAEARKAEPLSPQEAAQLAHYEKVKQEMTRLRSIPTRSLRLPPNEAQPEDPALEAARVQLEEAKKPVAEIVDRLDQLAARYQALYSVDKLVAEYAKDRFDLVINPLRGEVLYQTAGDVPDITQSLIAFVQERVQPLETR